MINIVLIKANKLSLQSYQYLKVKVIVFFLTFK